MKEQKPLIIPSALEDLLEQVRQRGTQGSRSRLRLEDIVIHGHRAGRLRRSTLLDFFAEKNGIEPPTFDASDRQLILPEVFSFIDDPDSALTALSTLVRAARDNPLEITVDQRASAKNDFCALEVLNVMAAEARRSIGTRFRGNIPEDPEAAEIVLATGLPRLFGVTKGHADYHVFPTQRGGVTGSTLLRTSQKERAADLLADYLARCFRRNHFELKQEAKGRFGNLVGEVLTNAEAHAGGHSWWVAGYMRKARDASYGDCHVVLFNFGPTIAETLQGIPAGDLRTILEGLVAAHRERRFFGLGSSRWTEEGLWTVYALQEGITRHYGEPNQRHGAGTADMIEEFQSLGQTISGELPKMCLVSGHTHIVFDNKYRIEEVELENGTRRRQIAFNRENDLYLPPDPGAVQHLRGFFPGTLISLRFFMDQNHLTKFQASHGTVCD